jgi:hypothetical protein
MVVTRVKMYFVILKMNGNLTLQMHLFLHFLEGGKEGFLLLFFVVLGLELRAYILSHTTSPFL